MLKNIPQIQFSLNLRYWKKMISPPYFITNSQFPKRFIENKVVNISKLNGKRSPNMI